MKVLFVTDYYHPYSGGVEVHVRTIAHELARRGHEVGVATLTSQVGEIDREHDGPVRVFPVEHTAQRLSAGSEEGRHWAPPLPDPVTARGVKDVVKRFQPDVLHGHDWLARSALPRWVSGTVPIITTLHYYTVSCAKKTLWRDGAFCPGPSPTRCLPCSAEHYGPVRGPAVVMMTALGGRWERRRSTTLVSVSAATASGNRVERDTSSVVIPNPVPLEAMVDAGSARGSAPDSGPHPAPDATPVPDGPFILYVGDIRVEKGVEVLADAVGLLRSHHDDETPLVVVGERMDPTIKLPDDTIEMGPVPNRVVQRLWRQATVGVVPSLWAEPFGLVAIEAMAAGCPVVGSRVGGLADILAEDRGVLVEPGDPMALAQALVDVLADPTGRSDMVAWAAAGLDRYALGAVVDRIEQEYRRVLGSH